MHHSNLLKISQNKSTNSFVESHADFL